MRTRLSPQGASVTGETELLIEGETFRPVAFAVASDGSIYLTDWVLREYPNHGRGRIWRLAAKPGVETMLPQQPNALDAARSGGELAALYAMEEPEDFARLKQALRSVDPFVRTAAIRALTRPVFREALVAATSDAEADVRLGALLTLHRAGHEDAEPIARRLLSDPDPRIRRMALVWIGRKTMASLRPDLDRALVGAPVSPELFETYLATVRHLQPEFVRAYRAREEETPR